MTQEQILSIALAQSAVDCGCAPEDFLRPENVIVPSTPHPQARRYLELPFLCDLVSYGANIVASVSGPYGPIVRDYLDRYGAHIEGCFETPKLHMLQQAVAPLGAGVCFMAEYWLPDLGRLRPLPCPLEMRLLTQADFAPLYLPQWSNALCEKRKQLDVLGVGAYDGDVLVGLAGCSADCEGMWQIGIDVLPGYRRRGIASALTAALALEVLKRDRVPFYCCAWSNVKSARNAIRSGFSPAWVEVTVKPEADIQKMCTV